MIFRLSEFGSSPLCSGESHWLSKVLMTTSLLWKKGGYLRFFHCWECWRNFYSHMPGFLSKPTLGRFFLDKEVEWLGGRLICNDTIIFVYGLILSVTGDTNATPVPAWK